MQLWLKLTLQLLMLLQVRGRASQTKSVRSSTQPSLQRAQNQASRPLPHLVSLSGSESSILLCTLSTCSESILALPLNQLSCFVFSYKHLVIDTRTRSGLRTQMRVIWRIRQGAVQITSSHCVTLAAACHISLACSYFKRYSRY